MKSDLKLKYLTISVMLSNNPTSKYTFTVVSDFRFGYCLIVE